MTAKYGVKRRLAILAAALIGATSSSIAAEKPNILVIWGDDIGQSNLSAYTFGLMGYKTPNIDSIAKEGSIQRAMSTQDFHRLQNLDGHDYLSAKAWYEVDCAAKKIRQVSLEIFPENMAMGGAVYKKTEPTPWADADDNSRPGVVWKGVCGKS